MFMNMQMRYFYIGPLDERTDQIVSLMCINGDLKNIQQRCFDYGFGLKVKPVYL